MQYDVAVLKDTTAMFLSILNAVSQLHCKRLYHSLSGGDKFSVDKRILNQPILRTGFPRENVPFPSDRHNSFAATFAELVRCGKNPDNLLARDIGIDIKVIRFGIIRPEPLVEPADAVGVGAGR